MATVLANAFAVVGESRLGSLAWCGGVTVAFVGSLYAWHLVGYKHIFRGDFPPTIRRRMASVTGACLASAGVLAALRHSDGNGDGALGFLDLFGMDPWKAPAAAGLGLGLSALLFLGPLWVEYRRRRLPLIHQPLSAPTIQDYRVLVAAPISEEVAFRSLMIPVMVAGGWSPGWAAALSPLFFGAAHLHHIAQHYAARSTSLREEWGNALVQLTYTTVFGWYSAFLYIRTGSVAAPLASHVFCNYMGVPEFDLIDGRADQAAYVVGLVGFLAALVPASAGFDSIFAAVR